MKDQDIILIRDYFEKLVLHKSFSLEKTGDYKEKVLQRKKFLMTKTKEFKKLDNETKLAEFKSLLKEYQACIDFIDNENKLFAEELTSLSAKLAQLFELREPIKMLLKKCEEFYEYNKNLAKDNDLLKTELKEITRQEQLSRQLAQKEIIKMRKESEEKINKIVVTNEANMKKIMKNKDEEELYVSRMEEELEKSNKIIEELRNDMLDQAHRYNSEIENKVQEIEKNSFHLQELKKKVLEMEHENRQLLNKKNITNNQNLSTENARSNNIESNNKEIRELVKEINENKKKYENLISQNEKTINKLERISKDQDLYIKQLTHEINQKPDYEELMKEVNMFRSIELGEDNTDKPEKLETFNTKMIRKNRELNSEIVKLKENKKDLEARINDLSKNIQAKDERLSILNASITNMESMIESTNKENTSKHAMTPQNNAIYQENTSLKNMIEIVKSQKERAQKRNNQLEYELSKTQKDLKAITLGSNSVTSHRILNINADRSHHYPPQRPHRSNTELSSKKSKRRKLRLTRTIDRFSVALFKLFVRSHVTRLAALSYAVVMHLLVFFVLVYTAHACS